MTNSTQNMSTNICQSACCTVLSSKIGSVRKWDFFLLLPQILLLVFFTIKKFFKASSNTQSQNSSVSSQTHIYKRLIWWTVLISFVRAILSMVLSSFATITGWVAFFAFLDKVLWCLMTGTLWLCELLVLDFGLSCNVNKLILRVVAMLILAQLVLEMVINDSRYATGNSDTDKIAFEHGHSIFWMVTSTVMCVFYTLVILLPKVPKVADLLQSPPLNITIPTRHSFYVYCTTLAIVYWMMTVGTFLMVFNALPAGFCLTDISSYMYYSFYALLLYRLLLSSVIQGENDDAEESRYLNQSSNDTHARYRPLMDDDGSDDELLNLGDQF